MWSFNNLEEESTKKQRTETEAYRANEAFMEVLHDKDSLCYKPWQFADYEVCVDTLKTTYDEVSIWGRQEAMIRPGWKVDANKVYVPNLFAKVSGTHKDIQLYREELNLLLKQEKILFFRKLPLYRKRYYGNASKVYDTVLNTEGNIDKAKLLASPYWRYRALKPSLQGVIANEIVEFCKIPGFWKCKTYNSKIRLSLLERIFNFFRYLNDKSGLEERIMKVSTFEILINLEENFLELLQNFDYPMEVPKIILYHNKKSGEFTFSDALLLMFMNSMGVDIIIYNPGGTSDIESFVKEEYFDIHRLEEVNDALPYKKNNMFYRIFNRCKS